MTFYPVAPSAPAARTTLTKTQVAALNDFSGYDADESTDALVINLSRATLNSLGARGLIQMLPDTGWHLTGAGYDLLCTYI